jgi:hypothetical protein
VGLEVEATFLRIILSTPSTLQMDGITTQNTNFDFFTAARASYLTETFFVFSFVIPIQVHRE